jgi:hypothetical protein
MASVFGDLLNVRSNRIFDKRFKACWIELCGMRKLPHWDDKIILSREDEFKQIFLSGLSAPMLPILSASVPPRFEHLVNLGWSEDPGCGVYFKYARCSDTDHQHMGYCGSATKVPAEPNHAYGLVVRRKYWEDAFENPNSFVIH